VKTARRRAGAAILAIAMTTLAAGPVSAVAPGLLGYEGQPGNQGGGGNGGGGNGGGGNKCAPGQHGNPQPGFKPGSC
jgi:hypothetical protein